MLQLAQNRMVGPVLQYPFKMAPYFLLSDRPGATDATIFESYSRKNIKARVLFINYVGMKMGLNIKRT
jgi:hypothetical protein